MCIRTYAQAFLLLVKWFAIKCKVIFFGKSFMYLHYYGILQFVLKGPAVWAAPRARLGLVRHSRHWTYIHLSKSGNTTHRQTQHKTDRSTHKENQQRPQYNVIKMACMDFILRVVWTSYLTSCASSELTSKIKNTCHFYFYC